MIFSKYIKSNYTPIDKIIKSAKREMAFFADDEIEKGI